MNNLNNTSTRTSARTKNTMKIAITLGITTLLSTGIIGSNAATYFILNYTKIRDEINTRWEIVELINNEMLKQNLRPDTESTYLINQLPIELRSKLK